MPKEKGDFKIESLGRPAIFLVPSQKLKKKWGGERVEEIIHRYLIEKFGGYSSSLVPNFGFWRSKSKKQLYDECREYEVSFVGKERIRELARFLANVALMAGEDCIYLKTGEDSWLVYPRRQKRKRESKNKTTQS